ncbi:ATP-binding protein [Candidatus Nitronereus thalassa]|uniref:ATP-binding protein n=1 Tax=Candidatus Nitronereus thalassa TaxID=3020898 RepID=A0ABU3K9E1_9BACT|nr:ATP-binding protein [Candidatus Nitronereus thalassa]MDT7042923.1 ATP-binding protein [Candidatus Nitronereus thalassa]
MVDKRANQFTKEDVDQIIKDEIQEGEGIEFKGQLPTKKGTSDPWQSGKGNISEYARDVILEEVIAFGNSYGGTVFLGVAESRDHPARAKEIFALRDCHDLADRIRKQCRDCIEPQIPIIECAGVATEKDGSGVVVIRVERSWLGPHRHKSTKECYVRRADRSEKLTMREIQDLTLQLNRALTTVDNRLKDRQLLFSENFKIFSSASEQAFGIRGTALPLHPVNVDRVHNREEIRPELKSFNASVGDLGTYPLCIPFHLHSYRPILRGTRGVGGTDHCLVSFETYSDGMIELTHLRKKDEYFQPFHLAASWAWSLFANVLFQVEKYRALLGSESLEFAFDIEIDAKNCQLGGLINFGYFDSVSQNLPQGTTIFPRYPIGPKEEFRSLHNIFIRDFLNSAGLNLNADINIDLNAPS